MMNKGIYIARRGFFNISTPMSENEIRAFIDALWESLTQMRPIIEELETQRIRVNFGILVAHVNV